MNYTVKKQGVEYYPKTQQDIADLVGCSKYTVAYHFSTKSEKEFRFNGFKITKD